MAEEVKKLKARSITLTFATAEELEQLAMLEDAATEDQRSLSKYLVRELMGKNES